MTDQNPKDRVQQEHTSSENPVEDTTDKKKEEDKVRDGENKEAAGKEVENKEPIAETHEQPVEKTNEPLEEKGNGVSHPGEDRNDKDPEADDKSQTVKEPEASKATEPEKEVVPVTKDEITGDAPTNEHVDGKEAKEEKPEQASAITGEEKDGQEKETTVEKNEVEEKVVKEEVAPVDDDNPGDEPKSEKPVENKQANEGKEDDKKPSKADIEAAKREEREKEIKEALDVDYTKLDKKAIVEECRKLVDEFPVDRVKDNLDLIKINFYKKHKAELEEKRKAFIDQGGKIEDFSPVDDPLEEELKLLLEKYKGKRNELYKEQEEQKENNLQQKNEVIDAIDELINRKESINKTFQEFRELQNRWHDIGIVPQKNVKDLWERYHYHVEKFYDYIKINKELRDLDLKKNMESKIQLCEKAEELIIEPSVIDAFHSLQKLHDRWRETGPVPKEHKEELWERFKEATKKINKRHQDHFKNLKAEQENNLEQKQALCEKAEEINKRELNAPKEWDKTSKELIEIQKVWRTIGFAPKKDNNEIYKRFREACDLFFSRKREFFNQYKSEQDENLQRKIELCVQVEAMKDSEDWKEVTSQLIELQKQWKIIGPVSKKHSDKVWKRFRAACDAFFNRKEKFFANIDSKYEDNLKEKEALIDRIKAYEPVDDVKENLNQLKKFQREWSEIGFVPIKQKDEIQQRFREAVNKKFDKLDIAEKDKNILKFKSKIEDISQKPKSDYKLKQEREKYITKLKKLESDIVLWENNIGFFANTKNAESMIQDVQNKIDNARQEMDLLKKKINLINDADD